MLEIMSSSISLPLFKNYNSTPFQVILDEMSRMRFSYTCLYIAQNNSFIQESAAKNYVKYPSQTFPPLLELAARAVVNMKVPITHGSIPHHLEGMSVLHTL